MKVVLAKDNCLNGCMVGRLAYENPWIIGRFDKEFYGIQNPELNRKEVILKYAEYIDKIESGRHCNRVLINPVLNLFHGEKDENVFNKFITDNVEIEKYANDLRTLLEDAVVMYGKCNITALNAIHD